MIDITVRLTAEGVKAIVLSRLEKDHSLIGMDSKITIAEDGAWTIEFTSKVPSPGMSRPFSAMLRDMDDDDD